MEISIKNLLPNPYRNIGNYPIDKERVAKLQDSILDTEFWGGLVCRKHPTKAGFYQIAFGHHRIEALKNLKYSEIPIKVLAYTDAQMIKAMAEENREIGQHDIKIMTQTVEQVKKFLDGELAKYETLNGADKFISPLYKDEGNFQQAKQNGVGRETILKFLGKTWKPSEIQLAIDVLKDEKIVDRKAVESFKNVYQAGEFKAAVKDAGIPVNKQAAIAKAIIPKIKGGRQIKEEVAKHATLLNPKGKKPEPKPAPPIDDFVKDVCKEMCNLHTKLVKIQKDFNRIQSNSVRMGLFLRAKDLQNITTDILEEGNKWNLERKSQSKK